MLFLNPAGILNSSPFLQSNKKAPIAPLFLLSDVYYRQPDSQCLSSFRMRQLMGKVRCVNTASIKQYTTTPSSSYSTSVIRKCFSLFSGCTDVHLLRSSFFGDTGFGDWFIIFKMNIAIVVIYLRLKTATGSDLFHFFIFNKMRQ